MSTPENTPDVLDGDWDPAAWWSTTNFGEAIPGVLTPLNWGFWGEPGERAARRAFAMIGGISEAETALPADPRDRVFGIFCGRFAAKVDFLGALGDRLPGTSGAAVTEQILGELPDGFSSTPTRRRWPAVARRLPPLVVSLPRRLSAQGEETTRWWSSEIAGVGSRDLRSARELWTQASERFERVMALHVACLFSGVQPVFDQVQRLAESAGDPGIASRLTTGQGSHAELALVEDLWRLSRKELDLDAFLARHGYHGPLEGEIASRVWREDPDPVVSMAARYAATDDAASPAAVAARNATVREAARRDLLAGLDRVGRAKARVLLALADRYLPLRGVGKVSFLQTLDVARAASRRIGEHLVAAGAIDEVDDVFFLTREEVLRGDPAVNRRQDVQARRARREAHVALTLPSAWYGRPEVEVPAEKGDLRLDGIGASPGVVEGRVRVVLDPTFEDVESGEILVAPTTDPSWASVLFTAAALVVDLGGQLSHAAVVARELGIPCVMGTGDGTRRLCTGDVCRVDGQAGTVEIVTRASEAIA